MKSVLVPLASGFEEIEAVTVIDVLRRAEVEVVVAGLDEGLVTGSRGIRVQPDTTIDQVDWGRFDLVALPGGGPGSEALRSDPRILAGLEEHFRKGKVCAAICAAPTVLEAAGLLSGRRATSHPAVQDQLREAGVNIEADRRVVVDGNLITSQSPGTAIEFAYGLVEHLCGAARVAELNAGILAKD